MKGRGPWKAFIRTLHWSGNGGRHICRTIPQIQLGHYVNPGGLQYNHVQSPGGYEKRIFTNSIKNAGRESKTGSRSYFLDYEL